MIRLLIDRPWWSTLKRLLILKAMNAAEIVEKVITGNPVAFVTRMAGNLKRLEVRLNPIQNGTPTPENPVAIEKNGQIKMLHHGRNLLRNKLQSGSEYGITWTVNADGSITLSGTAEADPATPGFMSLYINPRITAERQVIGYGTLKLCCSARAAYNPVDLIPGLVMQMDMYVDGTYKRTIQTNSPTGILEGGEIAIGTCRLKINEGTVIPEGTVYYPQLELTEDPSVYAPSAYEAYNPESAALTLVENANVYGGTLMPIANPEGGSDMGMILNRWKEGTVASVSEIRTSSSGTGKYVYIQLPTDAQTDDQIKCVYMEVAKAEAKVDRTCAAWTTYVSGNTIIVFVPSDSTSESAAAALTGAKFVYRIAIMSSFIPAVEIPVFAGANTYSINTNGDATFRYLDLE